MAYRKNVNEIELVSLNKDGGGLSCGWDEWGKEGEAASSSPLEQSTRHLPVRPFSYWWLVAGGPPLITPSIWFVSFSGGEIQTCLYPPPLLLQQEPDNQ
jgi:hypothetical protein